MNIKCLLFGHIPLRLNAIGKNPMIVLRDEFGNTLVKIDMCERCQYVYGISYSQSKPGDEL